jgi:hypothetical protein
MGIFDLQSTWTPVIELPSGKGDSFTDIKKLVMGSGTNRLEANIKDGMWLGGDTFASAKLSMGFDGVLTAQDVVITGGSITNIALSDFATGTAPSIQGWTSDLTFSSSDNDTVAWASGSIKLTDGTTYSISAGNTGNMTAVTYIYLDTNVSETALQTTTTATNAVGNDRILIAVAEDVGTGKDAIFQVFGGAGGVSPLITADNIAAETITANEIAANTITANEIAAETITATEISVDKLDAISANLGAITAGSITGVTVTGATIQTAETGRRIRLTNDQFIRWYNNSDNEAFLGVYSDAQQLWMDADGGIKISSDGAGDFVSLYAGTGHFYAFSNANIYLESNRDTYVTCDNWNVAYNDDDDGSDCFWYSNGSLKMKLDQSGDLNLWGDLTNTGDIKCGGTFKSSSGDSGLNQECRGYISGIKWDGDLYVRYTELEFKDGLLTEYSGESSWYKV